MTSQTVGIATRRDPILSEVHSYLLKGWPEVIPPELRQYYSRMAELSVEGKCVLWGNRVIIPKTLQNRLLQDLHREHMGISKMKAMARGLIWWPGILYGGQELTKK